VKQDELTLHIGVEETFQAFSDNLRGLSPGDEKSFDVAYPEELVPEKLAGKNVRFHANVKGLRRKDCPS